MRGARVGARAGLLALVCGLALLGAADSPDGRERGAASDGLAVDARPISAAAAEPALVRAVDPAAPRADGALFALGRGGEAHRVGAVACRRVHAVPGRGGLCLGRSPTGPGYDALVLGAGYGARLRFPVEGIPDRARVSRDGRYGAYTSFDPDGVHTYVMETTRFTTYTRIVDMADGRVLLRLEELSVTRAGRRLELDPERADLWGVTFAGGERFYATLALPGRHYLIAGDLGTGRARVVRDRVECPSLSPDGRRIAYKRRIGDTDRWRLHVLDLASGRTTALAERRSIDDQPEWLGNGVVAYSDDAATFAVPADGGGAPRRIAGRATSPAALAIAAAGAGR